MAFRAHFYVGLFDGKGWDWKWYLKKKDALAAADYFCMYYDKVIVGTDKTDNEYGYVNFDYDPTPCLFYDPSSEYDSLKDWRERNAMH